MQKIWENNGTEEIGLVTPTPGQPGMYDHGHVHGYHRINTLHT